MMFRCGLLLGDDVGFGKIVLLLFVIVCMC